MSGSFQPCLWRQNRVFLTRCQDICSSSFFRYFKGNVETFTAWFGIKIRCFLSIHLDISSRVCANKSGYFWRSFETFPATKARYFYRDVKKFPALFVVIQPDSLRRRQNNLGNFIEKSAHFQQFLCQQIQIFFSRCLDMFSVVTKQGIF